MINFVTLDGGDDIPFERKSIEPSALLSEYDAAAVDRSPIKYADAVSSVIDKLINYLDEFKSAHAETVGAFSKLTLKLDAGYVNNPRLTEGENLMLSKRQQALARRLELGINDVESQLVSIKTQAEEISARIDRINRGSNSIVELAKLESAPRASFEFLVENAVRLVDGVRERIEFFTKHRAFVKHVLELWSDWSEDYKAFKTSKREEFLAACRAERIDDEIYEEWYDAWQARRFAIEQRVLPLLEFGLKGDMTAEIERALSILETLKFDVDDFYLLKRAGIRQKFLFAADGERREKLETARELARLKEKFQKELQTLIAERERTEERMFLARWSEPLQDIFSAA